MKEFVGYLSLSKSFNHSNFENLIYSYQIYSQILYLRASFCFSIPLKVHLVNLSLASKKKCCLCFRPRVFLSRVSSSTPLLEARSS